MRISSLTRAFLTTLVAVLVMPQFVFAQSKVFQRPPGLVPKLVIDYATPSSVVATTCDLKALIQVIAILRNNGRAQVPADIVRVTDPSKAFIADPVHFAPLEPGTESTVTFSLRYDATSGAAIGGSHAFVVATDNVAASALAVTVPDGLCREPVAEIPRTKARSSTTLSAGSLSAIETDHSNSPGLRSSGLSGPESVLQRSIANLASVPTGAHVTSYRDACPAHGGDCSGYPPFYNIVFWDWTGGQVDGFIVQREGLDIGGNYYATFPHTFLGVSGSYSCYYVKAFIKTNGQIMESGRSNRACDIYRG